MHTIDFHTLTKQLKQTLAQEYVAFSAEAMNVEAKDHAYDLLTIYDKRVEDAVRQVLCAVSTEIGFVGEEAGGDRSQSAYWLVDPIDGTIHFVRNTDFYTSAGCLVVDGETKFSYVYHFASGVMYYAIAGGGAFRDGIRVQLNGRSVREAVVAIEANVTKNPANRERLLALFDTYRVASLFSPSYEYTTMLDGFLDARVQLNPYGKDYDFSPGALLIQEAGGCVQCLDGSNYNPNQGVDSFVIATSKELADTLCEQMLACGD